jgi:hypothetical protein
MRVQDHFQAAGGISVSTKRVVEKKAKLSRKAKVTKAARKSKAARFPLSNEKLELLGSKHKPALRWYDEPELP